MFTIIIETSQQKLFETIFEQEYNMGFACLNYAWQLFVSGHVSVW